MSTRTILEINHDFLPYAEEELKMIVERLPYMGVRALQEAMRDFGSKATRVKAQRHHSDSVILTINGVGVWVEK